MAEAEEACSAGIHESDDVVDDDESTKIEPESFKRPRISDSDPEDVLKETMGAEESLRADDESGDKPAANLLEKSASPRTEPSSTPLSSSPPLSPAAKNCDACRGRHVRHTCGEKGGRAPRSSFVATDVQPFTPEEFRSWHDFRKKQWRDLRLWRKQQRAPRPLPGECAARRPHNSGGFACESCGGRFARCFGSYGTRDAQGVWTPGSSTVLASLPESPNGRWCCAPCEALATNPPPRLVGQSQDASADASRGLIPHPFSAEQPRPFKSSLVGVPDMTAFQSTTLHQSGARKKDPNAPKQAKSAYLFFADSVRDRIKREHPEADFMEMGKLTGLKWKALTDEEKEPFNAQAAVAKEEYQKAMAAYVPPPAPASPASANRVLSGGSGGVVMVGGRCRECPGCLAPDCGKCRFCVNKVKFGGPGNLKHACIDRKCTGARFAQPLSPALAAARAAAAAAASTGLPALGPARPPPACAACRGQHKRHTCDPSERIPRTQAAAYAAAVAGARASGAGWVASPGQLYSTNAQGVRKKDPNAPKQAKSAYLFFADSVRNRIKREHPDADFIETGKLTGLKWKALTDEQKEPFNAQAAVAKEEYQKAMAAYVPPPPPPSSSPGLSQASPPSAGFEAASAQSSGEGSGGAFADEEDGSSLKRKRASGTMIMRLKDVIVQEFKARYEEEVAAAQAAALSAEEGSSPLGGGGGAATAPAGDGGSGSGGANAAAAGPVVVQHKGMTVWEVLARPAVAAAVAEAGISKPPLDIARDFLENALDTRIVRAAPEPVSESSAEAASQDAATVAAANAAALAASAMVDDDDEGESEVSREATGNAGSAEETGSGGGGGAPEGAEGSSPSTVGGEAAGGDGAAAAAGPYHHLSPLQLPGSGAGDSGGGEARFVFNPLGCDKRPNVSRQSLVRATHCASGARVLMRGSHVAYALANAVAAHAYSAQGKKCPLAGSIQSSVHARLRRNAGDRADAYGFEWVAVLAEDEEEELRSNAEGTHPASLKRVLTTEAEAEAYGKALVNAQGGGAAAAATARGDGSSSPPAAAAGAGAGGAGSSSSGGAASSSSSASSNGHGSGGFSTSESGAPLPRVQAPRPSNAENWKSWKCPEPGCTKAYTSKRTCSKHPSAMCVNVTASKTEGLDQNAQGASVTSGNPQPSNIGAGTATAPAAPVGVPPALQQFPDPSGGGSAAVVGAQPQSATPYAFVSANRVYVAL